MEDNNQKLIELLAGMNVPEARRQDLRWLARNLAINNADHDDFPEAIELLKKILKN